MHPVINKIKAIKDELVSQGASDSSVRVYIKEHLQDHVLKAIYSDKKHKNLIFYGGTCLRKIYNLNRMSEDLDFETDLKIDLEKLASSVCQYFSKLKLEKVNYKIQSGELINRITFKYPVLYDLGMSGYKDEKLHVKVEVNDKQKINYETEITPYVKDQFSMLIKHYQLATLMSGKMTACIDRVFKKGRTGVEIKGRDFYDLIWYMSQKISPDEKKLKDNDLSLRKAFLKLDDKINKIKSKDLLIDLEPMFVDNKFIVDWCDNFHSFYKRYRQFYG